MKRPLRVSLRAHAKINLSLGVGAKRSDGYHEIRSLMQGVELADELTVGYEAQIEIPPELDAYRFECEGCPFVLYGDGTRIPMGEENLIVTSVRALVLRASEDGMFKRANESIAFVLKKELPVAAGIAGGSGNAAAAMLGLNALRWNPYPLRELMDIGTGVGADVPFSLFMNAAYNPSQLVLLEGVEEATTAAWVSGLGEIIEPTEARAYELLLANPGIAVSTAEVYRGMDAMERTSGEGALFTNDMEDYTLNHYPKAKALADAMKEHLGAEQVLMSGSGPTMAAYYSVGSTLDAEAVRSASWWNPDWNLWATRTGGEHEGLE